MGMKDALDAARQRGNSFNDRYMSTAVGGVGGGDDGPSAGGVVGSSQNQSFGMSGLGSKGRADAAEQYKHNTGWVFSSIRIIAQRIAKQPLRVARFRRKKSGSSSNIPTNKQFRAEQLPGNMKGMRSELELVDHHDLIDTINDPNPIMVRWSLMYVTVASLELTGKAFWWIKRGEKGSGRKWEIWHVPSDWVTPNHSENHLFTSWTIRPPGAMSGVEVGPDDLAYFYYPDPSNPLGVLSPLQAQARAVVADEFIIEAQRRGFMNSIWPGHAIIIGRTQSEGTGTSNIGGASKRVVLTKQQRQTILSAIKNAYRGVYRSDEPIILDGLVEDIKKITNSNREMDFLNSSKLTKSRVTQGFGVNPISMGEIEGANRSSAQVADEHLCANTVNPKIELISECLTAWVCPIFDGGRKDTVAFLEECQSSDPEMELKRAEAGVRAQAMSINEFRHHILHLGPVHGGDVILVNGSLRPMSLVSTENPAPSGPAQLPGEDGEEDEEPPEEPEGEEEDTEKGDAPPVSAEDLLQASWKLGDRLPAGYWSYGSKLAKDALRSILTKSISEQEDAVVDTMRAFFRSAFADVVKKARELAEAGQIFGPEPVVNLIDKAAFTARMKDALFISLKPVVQQGMATEWWLNAPRTRQQVASWSPRSDAGVRRKSVPTPPEAACEAEPLPIGGVNSILTEMPAAIKDEVDRFTRSLLAQPYWGDQAPAVRESISKTISESLKAGDSNQEMIAKLNTTLGDEASKRAVLIARTETTGALNAGQDIVRNKLAAEGLIMGKEWTAALDIHTRNAHVEAHGQKVAPGQMFTIGGEEARYPGDTMLSAEQRCHCRCAAISVVVAEDPALAGAVMSDKAIAQALMISDEQAGGLIREGAEVIKSLLNLPSAEEARIRSFVGSILKRVTGSTAAKRASSFTKLAKGKIKCSLMYKAMNGWWGSKKISERVASAPVDSPVSEYLAGVAKLVELPGAYGVSPGVTAGGSGMSQAGYWAGLAASYAQTPYATWLALPGASEAVAAVNLLGTQVGFRSYLATRWLGGKIGRTALGKVAKGGMNVASSKTAKEIADNIDKVFGKLVAANRPAAGSLEDWRSLIAQALRMTQGV